jgi:hypothetical protein
MWTIMPTFDTRTCVSACVPARTPDRLGAISAGGRLAQQALSWRQTTDRTRQSSPPTPVAGRPLVNQISGIAGLLPQKSFHPLIPRGTTRCNIMLE